ncbi:MAG: hypothetical protein GEV11_23140 [Streptosporangiales bacterium]|nr:hypothetical protein [Streptosporangiales bacterium]
MTVALVGAVAVNAWARQGPAGGESTTSGSRQPVQARGAPLAERPTLFATGRELHDFNDVATMTATSPLVIFGRVETVRAGRWSGGAPGDRDRVRDVTIAVDQVLASGSGARPEKVVVDEWGWDGQGRGFEFKGVRWTEPGDRGFYFLIPVTDAPGHYRLINSQGRVLVQGETLQPSAGHHDDIHAEITAMSAAEFARSVPAAFRDHRAGKVRAQQPLA